MTETGKLLMERGLTQEGDLHVFKNLLHLWGDLFKGRSLFEGGGGGGGELNRIITVFVLQLHVVNFYLVIQNCL